jgi:DNA-binding response OmpR family regulator
MAPVEVEMIAERQEMTAVEPVRVLVVEDEPMVREVVARYLRREGYEVRLAGDGETALAAWRDQPVDLILLDLMLPRLSGMEVCRQIRTVSDVPIIMLTARGEETDKVIGLGIGADDYVTKPFSPRELVARVQALLRRARPVSARGPNALIRSGDIEIDPRSRSVRVESRPVQLTAKEFDLLHFLASHPNHVFTRDELMNRVWDFAFAGDTGTVTVHVRRLRQKIEPDPDRPRYLKTVWGVGYKFEPAQA